MPEFPIVDTHVHLLMNGGIPYRSLCGSYSLADYNRACEDVEVDTIVFMECDCELTHYREEVAFASGVAHADGRIKAIVAAMPLEQGVWIESGIAELVKNPLVKGVRRLLKFERADFCLEAGFIEGVRLLGKYGLSFDICTALEQNENVAELVSRCPEVSFIVDHIGTPDIKGGRFEVWKEGMGRFASFPNVHCKLSSMATEADHESWSAGDIRPYFDYLVDVFGVDRLLFGGDWPVSLVSASFKQSVSLLDGFVSSFPLAEQKKIFRDNALSFYRIG